MIKQKMYNITRGKIWGTTSTIFQNSNVEIARIEVEKDGYCSKHIHQHKHNLFFVEEGCLEVTIYRTDANQTIKDKTILRKGDSTFVEPLVYHQFRAIEDTIAFEIYWVELEKDDIRRETVGGISR